MENKSASGHLFASVTILIWGNTFISTKILLVDFQPIEILFFRFVIGLLSLLIIYPQRLRNTTPRQELTFLAAGLCGVSLYYLMENIALTFTMAANVSVIISTAPFFTAILSQLFLKEEKLRIGFFIGFAIAMTGIFLVSFSGSKLELNPAGDILALLASFLWACYSILTKKISSFGYNTIQTTRRIFVYGILFMIPAAFPDGLPSGLGAVCKPCVFVQHRFPGPGGVSPVLCLVEFCGPRFGGCENQRLHLHGPCHYSDYVGFRFARKDHCAGLYWNASDPDRLGFV